MSTAAVHATPGENALLTALPTDVRDALLPRVELIEMPFGQVILRPDAPIRRVIFPLNLIGSILTPFR